MELIKKITCRLLPMLILVIFAACSGSDSQSTENVFSGGPANNGTEVSNVANPNGGSTKTKTFETEYYYIKVDIPRGWVYYEYGLIENAGPEAFSDIDDKSTRTVAHFEKKGVTQSTGHFTIFEHEYGSEKDFEAYIKARHSEGPDEIRNIPADDENPNGAKLAFVYFEEIGPHGGFFFDAYIEMINVGVVWIRTELVGTEAEMEAAWNDFWGIVKDAKITRGQPD